jgi:hypothetical protein
MLKKAVLAIQAVEAGLAAPRTFGGVLSGYSGGKIIALCKL